MKSKRMQMGGMARPGMLNRFRERLRGAPVMTRPGFPVRGDVMTRPGFPVRGVMRGGGLARKGVGMALARGGLVKANGCAQRGKTKGKIV